MLFDKNISEVFGIDVWQLKPEYSSKIDIDDSMVESVEETIMEAKIENDVSEKSTKPVSDILYSNNVNSSKKISIYISTDESLDLFKEVTLKMFYKSSVNIYSNNTQKDSALGITISGKDIVKDFSEVNSLENKKSIFTKCYEYADF